MAIILAQRSSDSPEQFLANTKILEYSGKFAQFAVKNLFFSVSNSYSGQKFTEIGGVHAYIIGQILVWDHI
jgi:hypothetical protein